MQRTSELTPQRQMGGRGGEADPARAGIALLAFVVVLVALWFGFDFLRSKDTPQLLGAVVAIVWGVGGVAALFTTETCSSKHFPSSGETGFNHISSLGRV